jgi:hypothetical protein
MIKDPGPPCRRVAIIDRTGSPKQGKPDMADEEKDYKVGTGRPPLHTRFRKGQSGNPGGRSQKKLHALLADAPTLTLPRKRYGIHTIPTASRITCGTSSAPCVKPSPLIPLDGGGWGGGEPTAVKTRQRRNRLSLITWASSEHLGRITPTLTRPHQGGGNALMICEYRSPQAGEGREGASSSRSTENVASARRCPPAPVTPFYPPHVVRSIRRRAGKPMGLTPCGPAVIAPVSSARTA